MGVEAGELAETYSPTPEELDLAKGATHGEGFLLRFLLIFTCFSSALSSLSKRVEPHHLG